MAYRPPSPIAATEHTPDALGTAAEKALREHGNASLGIRREIGVVMRQIADWAWQGEGDPNGLGPAGEEPGLIVGAAEVLFRSPADALYGRPILPYLEDPAWVETMAKAIGTDTPLAATLVAAGVRLELMDGKSILPSSLAVLFRVDPARIHVQVQKGVLIDANADHPYAGKSGRRTKGSETRITAASAFTWLREQGRVPPHVKPPTAKKTKR